MQVYFFTRNIRCCRSRSSDRPVASAKYAYFLGPLQPYVTIHTGADTGKKLIIFKDSYAHCLAPMLMADYSEIRLVDLRSFRAEDYGAFVQAERYDEALFLYSTDTFSQQLGPGHLS